MKRIFIIFLCLSCFYALEAQKKQQTKLELIQGIWEKFSDNELEKAFKIVNGNNSLGVIHSNNESEFSFYLSENIEGFQDYKENEVDSININSFNAMGAFYTTVLNKRYISKSGWVKMSFCIIPEYFECDGETMSINGGKLIEFTKIKTLPLHTLKLLHNRGKKDNRNYIKDYLALDVREIEVSKSNIFSEPNKISNMYLIQGDIVTILEDKGDWMKIEYQGIKNIQGWIKAKDLK